MVKKHKKADHIFEMPEFCDLSFKNITLKLGLGMKAKNCFKDQRQPSPSCRQNTITLYIINTSGKHNKLPVL